MCVRILRYGRLFRPRWRSGRVFRLFRKLPQWLLHRRNVDGFLSLLGGADVTRVDILFVVGFIEKWVGSVIHHFFQDLLKRSRMKLNVFRGFDRMPIWVEKKICLLPLIIGVRIIPRITCENEIFSSAIFFRPIGRENSPTPAPPKWRITRFGGRNRSLKSHYTRG